jgi:hypothetical protein
VIGRFYGGRDHSTVCYGIQRIESLSEGDPEVDALLADLKRQLGDCATDSAVKIPPESRKLRRGDLSDIDVERIATAVAEKVWSLLQGPSEVEISTGL